MRQNQGYDHLIKLLVIGNSGVGKTNMLLRFCENNFLTSHLTTIGIDFKIKTVTIDGAKIRLQIWDTAGQERFKTITQTYYRGAMGIVLVYSIDDRDSFRDIENWIKQIKTHASDTAVKILVANKCDTQKRVVTTEEGKNLAKELDIDFYQTSARMNTNIETAFMAIAKSIKETMSDQMFARPKESKLASGPYKDPKDKKACC